MLPRLLPTRPRGPLLRPTPRRGTADPNGGLPGLNRCVTIRRGLPMGRLWAGDHEGAMVGAQRVRAVLTSIMVGVSVGVLTSQPAIARPTTRIDPGSGEGLDPFRAHMSSETLAIMRKQEALHPAVEILQRAIRESSNGYAGLALEGDGITLYWKGDLPSDVTRAMRSAQKIGPIKVRSARFSRAELEFQAERISSVGRTDIQSIFVPGDGSGISIEKMPPEEAGWAALNSPVTTAEQAVASAPSNIPVKIATAQTSVELTACAGGVCSRLDDESAWNSGTFIARNGTYLCSTGFGVNVLSQPGLHHILTAAHCGSAGDYFIDFTGELVGSMGIDDWDRVSAPSRPMAGTGCGMDQAPRPFTRPSTAGGIRPTASLSASPAITARYATCRRNRVRPTR